MRKAIYVGAILGCFLLTGQCWARGGGGGGGHGGGGHAGGVGGAHYGGAHYGGAHYGGYGYGGGFGYGVGAGLGIGLYGGGLYGGGLYGGGLYAGGGGGYYSPGYSDYYYATPPPPAYPYPNNPYGPNNPGVFPPNVPPSPDIPPMPQPTFAANGGSTAPQTTRPVSYTNGGDNQTASNGNAVNHAVARVANHAPVQLEVMVPSPDAKVYVDDKLTTMTGSERIFVSPPLERGYAYSYKLRVVWNQDGKEVSQERQVRITPGVARTVDFTSASAPIPLPPPSFDTARE